jgi:hypothetical protein
MCHGLILQGTSGPWVIMIRLRTYMGLRLILRYKSGPRVILIRLLTYNYNRLFMEV